MPNIRLWLSTVTLVQPVGLRIGSVEAEAALLTTRVTLGSWPGGSGAGLPAAVLPFGYNFFYLRALVRGPAHGLIEVVFMALLIAAALTAVVLLHARGQAGGGPHAF